MSNGFGFSGLGVMKRMPLCWEIHDDGDGELSQSRRQQENLRLRRALLVMDERVQETKDQGAVVAPELLRIESKLDLLMELVVRLMPDALPAQQDLWLGVEGIGWQDAQAVDLRPGDSLCCHLYPDSRIPLALHLSGRVLRLQNQGALCAVALAYQGLSEEEGELLQRYIFRLHRRQIARGRAPESS